MSRPPFVTAALVAILVVINSHVIGAGTVPADACVVALGSAPIAQRSAQLSLVASDALVLQAVVAKAATAQLLLPAGFNYSLHSLVIAVAGSLVSGNASAFQVAFYQVCILLLINDHRSPS